MIYILVSGRAGTGKDTCSNYIAKVLAQKKYFVSRGAFAKGVKDTATFMGWNGEKDEKGRKLLQDIGNVGRQYDKDIWVKQTVDYYKDSRSNFVIISDWRFPNESDYILKKGYPVITIRVEAPEREALKGTSRYNDVSETSLPSYDDSHNTYDFLVKNNGSYEDLYEKLDSIVEKILDLKVKWRLK